MTRLLCCLVLALTLAACGGSNNPAVCGEPTSCPAADRLKTPVLGCLSPPIVTRGGAFTLQLFGTHLKDDQAPTTKISIDGAGVSANVWSGVPVSACHLTLELPSDAFSQPGEMSIRAITGAQSGTVTLTVQ